MSYQGIVDTLQANNAALSGILRFTDIEPGVIRELNLNGAYDYCNRVSIVGFSNDIDVTFSDVGGAFNYDTVGAQLSCVSTSAQDAITGTGIQVLYLEGLDLDYNEIADVVVMNGLTPVLTAQTFLRLKRVRLVQAGSGKTAAGTITLTGDGFNWITIEPGDYVPLLGRYTVPAGHSLILTHTSLSSGRSGDFEILFMLKGPGLAEQYASRLLSSRNFVAYENNALIPEKTDLWFKARRDGGGGGDPRITVGLDGILFDMNHPDLQS
tara:strand:- start:261 stop:1061 length:801 start_codon:yes stop_codon:yes gene_type:complete